MIQYQKWFERVDAKPGDMKDLQLRVHQAEWHVRGLTYHCRNLIENYDILVQNIADMVIPGLNVMFLNIPGVEKLFFEFYALVNLARISLDNLRNILYFVFKTPYGGLPKSINDFKSGYTDCLLYERIANESIVTYLSDIRNYIVHYRGFATKDNIIVTSEKFWDMNTLNGNCLINLMLKIFFRFDGENKILINSYLPDIIFIRDYNKEKLAHFTYNQRVNLISQSYGFVEFVALSTIEALELLIKPGCPTYTYKKIKKT